MRRGITICADILRTTKQKKYAYFSFHECRNHPIDFDMMNSKGFLVRSAKGLNDCTGGYNNFTDLKGFFQFSQGNRAASPVVIERIPARTRLVSFQLRFFKIPIVDQITVVSVFPCQNIIIETLFPVDIINGILYLLLLRQ